MMENEICMTINETVEMGYCMFSNGGLLVDARQNIT